VIYYGTWAIGMCEYDDLEVGDVFYHPAGHPRKKANKWTIIQQRRTKNLVAIRDGSEDKRGTQISKTQWHILSARNRIVSHKKLLSDNSEETIFLHTLAGTLYDLLSAYGPSD